MNETRITLMENPVRIRNRRNVYCEYKSVSAVKPD